MIIMDLILRHYYYVLGNVLKVGSLLEPIFGKSMCTDSFQIWASETRPNLPICIAISSPLELILTNNFKVIALWKKWFYA